jgi:hypothetical protein
MKRSYGRTNTLALQTLQNQPSGLLLSPWGLLDEPDREIKATKHENRQHSRCGPLEHALPGASFLGIIMLHLVVETLKHDTVLLAFLSMTQTKKKRLAQNERNVTKHKIGWCERGDLNSHALSGART